MAHTLEAMPDVVQQIHPLNAEDWAIFASIWQPFEAKRRVVLTTSGSIERYLYFVVEGVQRAYAIDESDKDVTLIFMYPPSF